MSSIDSVIARSRRPGEFSERRRFTVARSRGIQKMRRFALADPHFYILELIQSAIANQAQYIDIQVDRDRCTCAYIGGGLREHELAQLFDFLFASKDRTDIGHIRELALGINAVLLFRPASVTIESGDGTLAGTTRMVVDGSHDQVEIGTPTRALAGTYVSIQGMQRRKLPDGMGRFAGIERPRECDVIETRCLAAPVPILVNHESLFGHSTQRTPGLFGYRTALAFDEGDLYGTLGHNPSFGNPTFELLTWGVSIQHKQFLMVDGQPIGGIVCFDRLHKTVDHSGIVEDERLAEMWARLRPYAEQLVTGKTQASVYALTRLDGHPVNPVELRQLLRSHPQVVLVPPEVTATSVEGQRAMAIGRSLEAHVLRGSTRHLSAMRALSGGRLRVLRPNLSTDGDVRFYAAPPSSPPPRPWLTPPVDVPGLPIWQLAARLGGASVGHEHQYRHATQGLADRLGGESEAEATVYTPEQTLHADALEVRVQSAGRLLWQGPVASAYAGHLLVVELPDAQVATLRAPVDESPSAPTYAAEIGRVMAAHAVPGLVTAFDRSVLALRDMDVTPGSAAAGMGLAAIVRSVLPRLRVRDGVPALDFSQLEARDVALLDLRLLQSVEGRSMNVRELAELANGQCGLVYGVIPAVPADFEGLDRNRVLSLTETEERQLVMLLGESSYVRIDARDVLASHRGVQCRDLAVGLRPFSSFPLLVEGDDPTSWPNSEQQEIEQELVRQLIRRFTGEDPPAPTGAWELAQWEECRRQACRQLQWYVCTHPSPGSAADLPLFLDVYDTPCSFRQVAAALDSDQGLTLYYGHAHSPAALGHLARAAQSGQRPDPGHRPRTLVATAYLHRLLAGRGRVIPAFDFDLAEGVTADAAHLPTFAAQSRIDEPGLRGVVGIPSTAATIHDIVVILPGRERTRALSELAEEHTVVGWVRLEDEIEWTDEQLDRIATIVRQACEAALEALIDDLPSAPTSDERVRRVEVLLGYATRHLSVHAVRPDHVVPRIQNELVNRVLSLPLFPSRWGGLVSAWRLVRRFCGAVAEGHVDPTAPVLAELSDATPAHLMRWLTDVLHAERVVREPGPPHAPPPLPVDPVSTGTPAGIDALIVGATLTHWLGVLRPDSPPVPTLVVVTHETQEPISSTDHVVWLSAKTDLVKWAQGRAASDPGVLVWPLLAVYAHINEVLERVTNDHEVEFQRRVIDSLSEGQLHLVRSRRAQLPPPRQPLRV